MYYYYANRISEYMAGIFGEADPLPEMNKSSSNSSSAAPNTINKGERKEIDNGDQEGINKSMMRYIRI